MSVPFTAQVVANESVRINTFEDGESVLLHLDTEHYFGLNDSGSVMWQRLTSQPSIEDAYHALLDDFIEVDPDELRRDLSALVDELVDHQLLMVRQAEGDG